MKTKRFFAVMLSVAMVFAILPFSAVFAEDKIWDGTVASSFAAGSGTEEDPYIITNGAELARLNNIDTEGLYFLLENDIILNDTSAENWKDGATQWFFIDNFKGDFDGNGYTISGIYIKPDVIDENASKYGLFGTAENAVIKNVNVTDSYIEGACVVGGVVGYAKNTEISGCSFDGTIKAFAYEMDFGDGEIYTVEGCEAGGIVGKACSEDGVCIISNCKNYGEIYSELQDCGGIVGYLDNRGEIYNCENHGRVYGCDSVGGIAGTAWGIYEDKAIVESCANYGIVTTDVANSEYIGGIVGYMSSCNMKYCTNYGNVGLETHIYCEAIGGIVGYAALSNYMEWCVNYGTVCGIFNFGGIIGCQNGYYESNGDAVDLEAKYLVNRGEVHTIDYVTDFPVPSSSNAGVAGGIVGFTTFGRYSYVYNYGSIYGYNYIGGIVGRMDSGYVEKAYNNGHIQGRNHVAGIVGMTYILYDGDIVISDSVNKGEIYSHSDAGGIVGHSYDYRYEYNQMDGLDVYSSGIKIIRVQNNGTVYCYTSGGGILGGGGYTVIENVANYGNIYGDYDDGYDFSWCGGLVGYVTSTTQIALSNGFSAGEVKCPSTPEEYYDRYLGGSIGYVIRDSKAILANLYYSSLTLPGVGMCVGEADVTVPKTISESEISNEATFENFDFEKVWVIKDGCPQIQELPESILGNVNGDDAVDKKDYAIVKRACFGTAELDYAQTIAADVNGDAVVDKKDYAIIKRACFGTAEIK